jgi:hypothetical protein
VLSVEKKGEESISTSSKYKYYTRQYTPYSYSVMISSAKCSAVGILYLYQTGVEHTLDACSSMQTGWWLKGGDGGWASRNWGACSMRDNGGPGREEKRLGGGSLRLV